MLVGLLEPVPNYLHPTRQPLFHLYLTNFFCLTSEH